jgi:hypothetical protein
MRRWSLLCLGALLATGCADKPPTLPAAVAARGTIRLPSGQPLTAGRVMLTHQDPMGVDAFGDVEPDGSFVLTTYQIGDGAVPGRYAVSISPFNYRNKSGSPSRIPNASAIPPRYLEAESSDLTVEIKEGGAPLSLQFKK